MKQHHSIAVRTLVDVVLRSGDLDMRFSASGRPLEGIRAHQRIQRSRPSGYRAEVPVSIEVDTADMLLAISGRVDGIYENGDEMVVEEIKSTSRDLDDRTIGADPCHWGQAKVYAHMLVQDRSLQGVTVRLTYCQLNTGDTLELDEFFTRDQLAAFFQMLIDRYVHWAAIQVRWRQRRDASIVDLAFPFDTFRGSQRTMAVRVYRTIRDGTQVLIQAATGIGKTMAALFPAVKTISEGHTERIFFLTARNTGKAAAIRALNILEGKGLRLKRVVLTAKDQICFCPDAACNPDECTYANGHFDRLSAALEAAFGEDDLDRRIIETLSRSHRVCPFEFSLELSRWADCIIADYNYAFDPRVYLRRFFDDELGAYAFLVDEAHNLVDRSRDMFSAQLQKSTFLTLRRAVKSDLPDVYGAAGKINTWMVNTRKRIRESGGFESQNQRPDGLEPLLRRLFQASEKWLATNQSADFKDVVLDCFFQVSAFLRIWDQFDDSYVAWYQAIDEDVQLKLFCLDPSGHLQRALQRARAVVFFSATLTPTAYFKDILGCHADAATLTLASPFPPGHLAVLMNTSISTYYAQRNNSLDRLVDLIGRFVSSRTGNYLCFFPSYDYLTMAADRFAGTDAAGTIIRQTRDMDDGLRADFLERFVGQTDHTVVGFAVMGGIFGEGIDLVGERLCGAVIVGVGLPAICPERNLIRDYFDQRGAGFDYAYRYPGINRVLQAAGRVIRSDQDQGVILLVDPRFGRPDYRGLLPDHWSPTGDGNARQMVDRLKRFWSTVTVP